MVDEKREETADVLVLVSSSVSTVCREPFRIAWRLPVLLGALLGITYLPSYLMIPSFFLEMVDGEDSHSDQFRRKLLVIQVMGLQGSRLEERW